jgi:lipopolysaccharide export system ATP-binding protein
VGLVAKHLVKLYNKKPVVDGVSIDVRPGEVVGLLGPNGAGKTTTFYLIVGLIRPQNGSIHLGKDEITNLPMYIRARKGIGYLAQEPSVFRKLTVAQNIQAVLETVGLARSDIAVKVASLLEELGLGDLADQRADRLSGGEARRLEITRALARDPKFLLLDEPFAGIDPKAVEDIQGIISNLKQRKIGLLVTDHNVRETLAITDRSYIMTHGKILTSGTPEELAANAEVRRIYLGERFRLD